MRTYALLSVEGITKNTELVMLQEELGGSAIEVVSFEFIDYGNLLAENEVYVLDSSASLSEITAEQFSFFGGEGMGIIFLVMRILYRIK